jgi:uridine kinase
MSTQGRRTHYQPPWGNANIIGVAGSSGSGKTSLAMAIVASMNLPWVVILSMVRQSGLNLVT